MCRVATKLKVVSVHLLIHMVESYLDKPWLTASLTDCTNTCCNFFLLINIFNHHLGFSYHWRHTLLTPCFHMNRWYRSAVMSLTACCDVLNDPTHPLHYFTGILSLSLCMCINQINPSVEDLSAPLECVIVPFRNNFTLKRLETGL